MAGASHRRIRPLRVLFAFVWGVVAVATLVVAYAEPGNVASIPTVADSERPFVLGYGIVALLASFVLAASASRRPRRAHAVQATARAQAIVSDSEQYEPIRQLRADGWYVLDGLRLRKCGIDHLAIGSAGVLAIQTMRSDERDGRADPAIRARVGADQLRHLFASKEIGVDVVPAVLAWGPGVDEVPGGVFVRDAVAVLIGSQADVWRTDLNRHQLLDAEQVAALKELVAELAEGRGADVFLRSTSPARISVG